MKQIITTGLLLFAVIAANAKSNISRKNTVPALNSAKMEIVGDNMKFTNLPKEATEVYIMDEQGIVEQSGVVNRQQNKVNIADLPKGNHVIALKIGVKIKVFGYRAEVVIKG